MRVLYVEDDPVNRKVMQAVLGRAGIVPDEAVNGAEGLERIAVAEYDVVLMDLRMPVMDGLTAIQHIRSRSDRKSKIPIIVVTADTSADLEAKCRAVGAQETIRKPVDIDRLFALLGQFGGDQL